MKCKRCGEEKTEKSFYFIDGGLGFSNQQMDVCKDCVKTFNNSRTRDKYFDEQIAATYFGAKLVIKTGRSIHDIARNTDNGVTCSSNAMAIGNFLFLLGKSGLSNSSEQMRRIFDLFENKKK